MTPDERLARYRKRFGITKDQQGRPFDMAVQICAGGISAMKAGEASNIDEATSAGFGTLSFADLRRLRLDVPLNMTLMATALGMMQCLTTEWH